MSFLNLLKATRLHRTLTVLGTLMIPVAFANKVNMDVIFLCLSLVILYAAVGIQNARKDKDYFLPKYSEKIILVLVVLSFLVSLKNLTNFVIILTTFLMGLFYNFYSRYILFMDVTTVAATHHALPMVGASLLLGLDLYLTFKLTLFIYVVCWLFIHIKNLKDRDEDKKRNYKTIATEFRNYKKLSLIFFEASFVLMFLGYFFFDFTISYLFLLIILYAMKVIISRNIIINKTEKALDLLRFMGIFFLYSIAIQKVKSFNILLFCSIPLISYFFILTYQFLNTKNLHLAYWHLPRK